MENNFGNMTRLKYCQIGNCVVSVYRDDTNGNYICTNTFVVDNNNIGKSMSEILSSNDVIVHEDLIDTDYDKVIMEMQVRLIEMLNNYFDDENEDETPVVS